MAAVACLPLVHNLSGLTRATVSDGLAAISMDLQQLLIAKHATHIPAVSIRQNESNLHLTDIVTWASLQLCRQWYR